MPSTHSIETNGITLHLVQEDDDSGVEWLPTDVSRIARAPFQVAGEDRVRFVSARDQLGVEIDDESVTLVDLAGVDHCRPELVAAVDATLEVLSAKAVDVDSYTWGLGGVVAGVDLVREVTNLFEATRMAEVFGFDVSHEWGPLELNVRYQSTFSERIVFMVDLGVLLPQDRAPYSATAHFGSKPDIGNLLAEGEAFRENIDEVVNRLAGNQTAESTS